MSRAGETVWEVFARKAYEDPLHHVGTVTESLAVTERRSAAHGTLTAARARLWTTESSGWDQDRTLERVLCTADSH